MKTIAFVCYLPRHRTKLEPVIKELCKNEDVELFGLYNKLPESVHGKLGDDPIITRDMFNSYGMTTIGYTTLDEIKNELTRIKPNVLVIPETHNLTDMIAGGKICDIARSLGINTVVIQHGQILDQSINAFVPMNADYFMAWGDWTRRRLIKEKVNPLSIIVAGFPELDEAIHNLQNNDIAYEYIPEAKDDKVAIIFYHRSMDNTVLRRVIDRLSIKGYKVILTGPTRLELPNRHQLLTSADYRIVRTRTPSELISVASLCIVGPSSTAIECIAMSKPTIEIMPDKKVYNTPFSTEYMVTSCFRGKDYTDRIFDNSIELSTNVTVNEYAYFLRDYLNGLNSKSSTIISDFILRS